MTGYDTARSEIEQELLKHHGEVPAVLDPFSGRGMIPLEAARLGARSYGIDYSPVATLASQLLADYPMRDWSTEPPLPFGGADVLSIERLPHDVDQLLREVGRRHAAAMSDFYPPVDGKRPWGYVWAVTLPCEECGHRFPLTGSLLLRHPTPAKGDPGQSYRIEVDRAAGTFRAVVHDGPPVGQPTLVAPLKAGKAVKGKAAVCPFCEHSHAKDTHQRLAASGLGQDAMLVAADLDPTVSKFFRPPTAAELEAVLAAETALASEPVFAPGLWHARRGDPRQQRRDGTTAALRRGDVRRPVQQAADAGVRAPRPDHQRPRTRTRRAGL